MWGETARASTSTGTYQLALTSTFLVAGRQPEVVARGVVPVQGLLDRLGEVKSHPRLVVAGLAVGVVVDLEDDVGLGGM